MIPLIPQNEYKSTTLDLDVPMVLGNIDRLPMNIEIDGSYYSPTAYLVADDINPSTGAWASRHNTTKTLALAGSGADPTYRNYTAIENTAIKYLGAKYHAASDTTWGQITTGDGAIECLFVMSDGTDVIAASRQGASPLTGWQLNTSSNTISGYFSDGTNFYPVGPATTFAAGQLVHVLVFMDRSYEAYMYINGVYVAISSGLSTLSGSIATSGGFTVGAWADGTAPFNGSVLNLNVWNLTANPFPGALKNRAYFDCIARERFAIIAGIEDQRKGAHTFTRATFAYSDKYISSTERRLFKVSSGWPRVCERKDANSTYVKGFLSEGQAQNLFTYSEDMSSWTVDALTTVSSNAIVAPDGETTADGLVANGSNTAHGVYRALTLPATLHCFSSFAKKGNKDWIELSSSSPNLNVFFNLNTIAVGTVGSSIVANGIEDWGNGWCRCWMILTGSASSDNFRLRTADADNDSTFIGDTVTINSYFWGAQMEAVTEYFPSSYIKTEAAAVTRNKDELSYQVKLPIVGNINDLSQTINIGGTDYSPTAYLVADDINESTGSWASRHNASKTLAYTGAGTNPTPNWDKISRANRSVKYWTSNYHQASDKTWGQLTTGDWAVELIAAPGLSTSSMFMSNIKLSAPISGLCIYRGVGLLVIDPIYNGTEYASTVAYVGNAPFHLMVFGDKSDKYYTFLNGIFINSTNLSAVVSDFDCEKLAIAAHPTAGSGSDHVIYQMGLWDLPTNPWPGAATNQAVMGAIARARFDSYFQRQNCRIDCDILHPNVNRQATGSLVLAGGSAYEYSYIGVNSSDYGYAEGAYNNTIQWNSLTTGSTDICDNVYRKLSIGSRVNSAKYYENNVLIGTDTSCTQVASQERVFVGQWVNGGFQPGCLVKNVKLWRSDR